MPFESTEDQSLSLAVVLFTGLFLLQNVELDPMNSDKRSYLFGKRQGVMITP